MKYILSIMAVTLLLTSCLTVSEPVKKDVVQKEISIEDKLVSYNLNVLSKIDDKQLPKFILAIIGDSTKIADANVDLGLLLQSSLNESGRVQVIDRDNMDKIFKEQELVLTGITEESSVEIGELLGAEFLLVSNVVATSEQTVDKVIFDMVEIEVTVQVKLINVSTGEVFVSFDEKGMVSEKLVTDAAGNLVSGALNYNNLYAEAAVKAADMVVSKLLNNFPAIGFVLSNKAGVIKTDLGSNSGIKVGSKVAVVRRNGAIFHPVTGELSSYDYSYLGYGVATSVGATSSDIELKDNIDSMDNSVLILID